MAVSVFFFQTGFVHILKTLELQDSYFEVLKVLEMLFLFIESHFYQEHLHYHRLKLYNVLNFLIGECKCRWNNH